MSTIVPSAGDYDHAPPSTRDTAKQTPSLWGAVCGWPSGTHTDPNAMIEQSTLSWTHSLMHNTNNLQNTLQTQPTKTNMHQKIVVKEEAAPWPFERGAMALALKWRPRGNGDSHCKLTTFNPLLFHDYVLAWKCHHHVWKGLLKARRQLLGLLRYNIRPTANALFIAIIALMCWELGKPNATTIIEA